MSGLSAQDLNVSRETLERLDHYVNLVKQWNPKINLVSKGSLQNIWTRHIADSVQIYHCAPDFNRWADIGSGGGFPGMVCAIISASEKPEARFTFVESDQRKCAFLRTVARECQVQCKVVSKRIESIDPLNTDILSARALADLTSLLQFCDQHLGESGTALLPKGANWKKELEDAQEEWNFQYEGITSLTEPQAIILKIKGVSRG